jgi:hypothetical protein
MPWPSFLIKFGDWIVKQLPETWRSGIAKTLAVLLVIVGLLTISAVAIAGIAITLQVSQGRGIDLGFLKIPDRAVQMCEVRSTQAKALKDIVIKSQNDYTQLMQNLKQFQDHYIARAVEGQDPKAANLYIQPIIDDVKKEIDHQENNLIPNILQLDSSIEKLQEGCPIR